MTMAGHPLPQNNYGLTTQEEMALNLPAASILTCDTGSASLGAIILDRSAVEE